MPAAEEVQELGRRGVAIIKRWLEATTHIELPYDVYNHTGLCTIRYENDGRKRLDLQGFFLSGKKPPLYVECKRYTTTGGQYNEFLRLLGIAYSAAKLERRELGEETGRLFFWVTFHPFNLDNWATLETHEQVRTALTKYPEYLNGDSIDEDLLRRISERVTVLVFNPKQEGISLTNDELRLVRTVLHRKADEL